MKYLLVLILLFCFKLSSAQFKEVNLNGQVFKGTATEILPPDSDRMPQMYDELIRFVNEKVYSDILNIYSSEESAYSAQTDERRMIALEAASVHFKTKGAKDGLNVILEFNGNLFGEKNLNGILTVKYPDNSEINFKILTESE